MDWIGSVALIVALAGTLLTIGYEWKQISGHGNVNIARILYGSVFFSITLAVGTLVFSLLSGDMRLAYVAMHTSHPLPWYYKLSALWAGQNGSLLLWSFLQTMFNLLIWKGYHQKYPEWQRLINLTMLFVQAYFLSLNIWLHNPFQRLAMITENEALPFVPSDGQGLNPLLHHPAMIFHPPLLLIGYVSSIVPFAIAVAALWLRKNEVWFQLMRPWTLSAWIFLTAGIGLGAFWAYVELGWGGYWAWDPVENASLIPWLISVALIHALNYRKTHNLFSSAALILAFLFYFFCVFGTFITRSGIIQSVHAFSKSEIGTYLFIFLLFLLLSFAGMFTRRKKSFKSDSVIRSFLSGESMIVLLMITLIIFAFAVLAGTLLPTLADIFFNVKITLEAHFFNRLTRFIAIVLLILLLIYQKIFFVQKQRFNIYIYFGSGFIFSTLFFLFIQSLYHHWYLSLLSGLLFFTGYLHTINYFFALQPEPNSRPLRFRIQKTGIYMAHLGFLFVYFGVAGSLANQGYLLQGRPGQVFSFHDYEVTIESFTTENNILYETMRATLVLRKNAQLKHTLTPEIRYYYDSRKTSTEVAIGTTAVADIYLSLNQYDDQTQTGSFQISYHPLVVWIWFGTLLMCSGGLMTLCSIEKKRI